MESGNKEMENDNIQKPKLNLDNEGEHPLTAFTSFFTSTLPAVTSSVTTQISTSLSEVQLPTPELVSVFGNSKSCTIKFIHINDVYEIDNLPHYATCKQYESGSNLLGMQSCDRALGTCSGDFLAPSLLSSLDKGCGMVDCFNKCDINYVCIGNHETDVPLQHLFKRIKESKFTWINSNMERIPFPDDVSLPKYSIIEVKNRKVALLGLNTEDPNIYAPGAFGGAEIKPLNETCKQLYDTIKANEPDIDCVVALTHQIMPLDRELAELMGDSIPIVLGGHDHEPYLETINGCTIVKTGADAKKIGIVELFWADDKKDTRPQVKVVMKECTDYSKNSVVSSAVDSAKTLLLQLDGATLCKIPHNLKLTSQSMRFQPTTMGTFICSSLKIALGTDVCIIAAGCIRANKDYTGVDKLTYAHLKQEIPFETIVVTLDLPGGLICDMIEYTRAFALQNPPVEKGGYLQTDDEVYWDNKKNKVLQLNGQPVKRNQMYLVAINQMLLEGLDNIEPLVSYIKSNPSSKKSAESGMGLKEIIVSHYSRILLLDLIKNSGDFNEILDMDGDGKLNKEEMIEMMKKSGHDNSTMLVDNLFNIADINNDGFITKSEIAHLAMTSVTTLDRSRTNDKISLEEHKDLMKETLGSAYDEKSAIDIFRKIDIDKSGFITHGELRNYRKQQTTATSRWSWI